MADKKISALTAATTPLAGTEVLPIVQSSTTKKVAVSDLTAGRAVSATELTVTTENVIIGTAGKGVDFSATTSAAGMTSELLNDYEEGTWTPVDSSGAGLTLEVISAEYTKIGRLVVATTRVIYPANVSTSAAKIGGLPFTSKASTNYSGIICNNASANTYSYYLGGNSTTVSVTQIGSVFTGVQNQFLASGQFLLTIIYNT